MLGFEGCPGDALAAVLLLALQDIQGGEQMFEILDQLFVLFDGKQDGIEPVVAE